jgi:hypothetical protein
MAQAMVTVPALVEFVFQGRLYQRGDLLTITPVEAAVLARNREVSLTRWAEIAPAPEQPKRRRRRAPSEPRRAYRRRDLVAES